MNVVYVSVESAQKLLERFNWRAMDFAYPDEGSRLRAMRTGEFIPENNLPVGIEIWGDKLFISVPRWRQGIPSSLNYISLTASHSESPRLTPYPDWNTNREENCQGITTTYRMKADACNRLWVLNTGTVGIGNTTEQVCPYSILVFDLTTDKLIRRYQLRPEDTNSNTFIANINVDIGNSCEDTFAYASDELGYGLIVYSWELNTSWRVEHPYFFPDPLKGDYNIAGLNFQWGSEGIFGLSLSPIQSDGYRTLFFHPLSSNREFAVSTKILRNRELALDSYHEFTVLPERGPNTHVTASFMDDDGIMYYNLIDQNAIGCWNSKYPYLPQFQGLIDKDDVGLVFPSDVKVDVNRNLWVMSDRMPVFLEAELDFNDINFRIYVARVDDALRGTVCEDPLRANKQDDILDAQEQYSRRNCLLLHGVSECPNEDTAVKVLNTVKEKLNIELTMASIDRCHRLGGRKRTVSDAVANGKRPIIVKFVRYHEREAVWRAKRALMGTLLLITESLTLTRKEMLHQTRDYVDRRARSQDGCIVLIDSGGEKYFVNPPAELDSVLQRLDTEMN
ncbi:protein yellow [Anabrus simplex]|uniref:protein yellow n=1 Tax=Anabrus simplex TaxID=316456 RepID=UPI0035A349B5